MLPISTPREVAHGSVLGCGGGDGSHGPCPLNMVVVTQWGDAGSSLSPLSVVVVIAMLLLLFCLLPLVPVLAVLHVIPPRLMYQLSSPQTVAHGGGVWSVIIPV